MSMPNIITLARILAVPITVWLIITGQFFLGFIVFVAAGVSDGLDGFIAKKFDQETELGAYLDPLADKLLLVSIYVALGVLQVLQPWLVILVVSRDLLIVGAVILSWLMDRPVEVKPLLVSKVNTTGQILLAGLVLAALGFGFPADILIYWGSLLVAALTVASGAVYMRDWFRHMANGGDS